MSQNKVSAVLEQSVVDGIITEVDAQEAKLPFLISLTDKEREALPRFGPDSVSFFNQALEAVKQNPGMMPGDFDIEEMTKDVALYTQLYSMVTRYSSFLEKLTDTMKEVGAESYGESLAVYAMAKFRGKSVGGMNSSLDELGKRFAKKTGKTPPPAK